MTSPPPADDVLALVETSLEDDQADDVRIIPLVEKSTIADYMVIASGGSARKVGAMTEHLLEKLKRSGVRGTRAEGRTQGDWVLIDAGDVIVHLFRPEVRAYYNLEKLWAPEEGADEADQRAQPLSA